MLNARSVENLKQLHLLLQKVLLAAATEFDFIATGNGWKTIDPGTDGKML